MKIVQGGVTASRGFMASGVHAGLKRFKKDMAAIVSSVPCTVAGTYTTNKVKAAPVLWDSSITAGEGTVSAVIVNSGNANACTGERGLEDCRLIAKKACDGLFFKGFHVKPENILICSTGVIGVPMPMGKIGPGVDALIENLSSALEAGSDAAESICTTDTYRKEIAVSLQIGDKEVHIGGMAKGAGMIHPNMATTLSFITTDALIEKKTLQTMLGESVEDTFNMISVDGDTSTNDTCLVLANGEAGNDMIVSGTAEAESFREALEFVLGHLAKELVRDGEGATRFIEVKVEGAKDKKNAKILARSVVSSSLFKAALFGADANWGRVLCAMGYSGADFDPALVDLNFSSSQGVVSVLESGIPVPFSEEKAKVVLSEKDVKILAVCHQGEGTATAWGCDLTYDYVKINGDYRS